MPQFRPLSDVSWIEALSRIHPMILHLPIAILVVLLLIEAPRLFRREPLQRDSTRNVLVLVLGLTAPLTAASGYFLGSLDSYGDPVDWHQRLGITTASVALLASLAYWRSSELYLPLILLGAVLLVPTAHLGATLTHGPDFLIEPWLAQEPPAAPAARPLAQAPEQSNIAKNPTDEQPVGLVVDSLATPKFTFDRDVLPIFKDFCFKCHGETKQKGELRLDSYESLFAGSEYGPVFIPGNALESRMVEMLRLDLVEDEHMPPENKPQPSEADLLAIEAWINLQ